MLRMIDPKFRQKVFLVGKTTRSEFLDFVSDIRNYLQESGIASVAALADDWPKENPDCQRDWRTYVFVRQMDWSNFWAEVVFVKVYLEKCGSSVRTTTTATVGIFPRS